MLIIDFLKLLCSSKSKTAFFGSMRKSSPALANEDFEKKKKEKKQLVHTQSV